MQWNYLIYYLVIILAKYSCLYSLFKHCILSYLIWAYASQLMFPNRNKSACTHPGMYVLPLTLLVTKWATNVTPRGITNIVKTLWEVNVVKMKQEIGGIPNAKNGNIRTEFSQSERELNSVVLVRKQEEKKNI